MSTPHARKLRHNGPLKARTTQYSYRIPRDKTGEPVPWVKEVLRLRIAGFTSVKLIANRVGRSWQRVFAIMRDPAWNELEIREALVALGSCRAKALAALSARASTGDPAAIRLVLELTGVVEAARPVLISLRAQSLTITQDTPPPPTENGNPVALASERDDIFRRLLGEPPIDVIFREQPKPEDAP